MPKKRTETELELILRVTDLEARVRSLEKRLDRARAAAKTAAEREALAKPQGPSRPRCPGCTLELPKGRRRGVSCVWCGFRFDAVPPWPAKRTRRRTKKRL